ncbi:unnamed protein product, partial [Discosporangium mesarthrocarpum]
LPSNYEVALHLSFFPFSFLPSTFSRFRFSLVSFLILLPYFILIYAVICIYYLCVGAPSCTCKSVVALKLGLELGLRFSLLLLSAVFTLSYEEGLLVMGLGKLKVSWVGCINLFLVMHKYS